MIRVTVEVVSAITGKTEVVGRAVIANDGTGTKARGNYNVVFRRKQRSPWKGAGVERFARRRDSVWYLLREVLCEALEP